MVLYRLNYAVDLRYGNLLEIARMVQENREIDLSNGHMNVIWQGDANGQALALLGHCATPPFICNITGPETVSIRRVVAVSALVSVPVSLRPVTPSSATSSKR